MTYFNTTNESGRTLDLFVQAADNQEQAVLELFRGHPRGVRISPSHVWKLLADPRVPLTSIRRAITNLTTQGHLVKTDEKRMGLYGREEYTWTLS